MSEFLMFVVSLECYDEWRDTTAVEMMKMMSFGQQTRMNCMEEQLAEFRCILSRINKGWCAKARIIMLLSKKDLFMKKVQRIPITKCPAFASYDGPSDSVEKGIEYIRNTFTSLTDRKVESYVIDATDQQDIRNVINDLAIGQMANY